MHRGQYSLVKASYNLVTVLLCFFAASAGRVKLFYFSAVYHVDNS